MATRNKRMPSNMTRQFGSNPPPQIPRSSFNLSRPYKTCFDSGLLIPFLIEEYLPGDTHKVRVNAFARLATPIKPVMDNLYMDFHFWACPNRQLWENWEKFMGEQDDPGDSTDFLVPQMTINPQTDSSVAITLANYFGIPTDNIPPGNEIDVCALPFRMYSRVWNLQYRDQNLQESLTQAVDDGPDLMSRFTINRRGKRHDYLTSALPFRQKGDPVQIPIGVQAPIFTDATVDGEDYRIGLQRDTGNNTGMFSHSTTRAVQYEDAGDGVGGANLFADLGSATGTTITDLRQGIAVQHMLERDARGGTRYPEILHSHFRVIDPSMMVLQRPEYLGGGSVPVNISPVPQTTPKVGVNPDDTPQGNLAAVGTASANNIGFTKSFTEHGWIMGLVSVRADLTYQQALERKWSRRERFDFYFPSLAHLSEQAVLSKEIYCDGSAADDDVWGYNGIYDEYRFGYGKITNIFNSQADDTLDFWHLSQNFSERPLLSDSFIRDRPPIDRVIAVPDEPEFIFDSWINHIAVRPMPVTGIPGLTRI